MPHTIGKTVKSATLGGAGLRVHARGSNKDRPGAGRRSLTSKLTLTAMLAAVVCLALVVVGSSHGLATALRGFHLAYLAPVLALSLINYLVRFARWSMYLRRCDATVGGPTSWAVFASGLAMSITPGKFGELFKAAMLRDEAGVPLSLSVPVVISERMTDLVAVVMLVTIGAARYPVARPAVVAVAVVVLGALVALAYSPAVMTRVKRLLAHRWPGERQGVDEAASAFALLLRGRPLLSGTLLGVLAWCAECAGLWLVLLGLGYGRLSLFAATFVYALSTLGGAVSLLPGGLGATEASMAGLLALFAVPGGLAVAAVILIRFCTLWFPTALGVIVYLVHRRSRRARATDAAGQRVDQLV